MPSRRTLLMAGAPLTLGGLLLFHPSPDEPMIYDGLRDHVTAWLVVHAGMTVLAALVAAVLLGLVRGLPGRAAAVSRAALAVFVVCFTAWEAALGLGTGILVHEANGLPPAEQERMAEVIQDVFSNPLFGEMSVFGSLGNGAWVVATIAAAVALRGAGASRRVTALVACSAGFAAHVLLGPIALAGLAVAVVVLERARPSSSAGALVAVPS